MQDIDQESAPNTPLFWSFFAALCLLFSWSCYVQIPIIYDGSDYFFRILLENQVIRNGDNRQLAFYLLHYPTLILYRTGEYDIFFLNKVFQGTHVAWPMLLLAFHYFILPKNQKIFAWFHMGVISLCNMMAFYVYVSEMHLGISFLCLATSQLLIGKPIRLILGTFFLVCSSTCYPIAFFLSLPLIVLPLFKKELRWHSTEYKFIAIVGMIALIYNAYSLFIYFTQFNEGFTTFFQAFNDQGPQSYAIATTIFLFTFLIVSINRYLMMISLPPIIAYYYHYIFEVEAYGIWVHYGGRTYAVVATIILTYLTISSLRFPIFQKVFDSAKTPLILFCLGSSLVMGLRFQTIKNQALDVLDSRKGIITQAEANKLGMKYNFASDHTMTQLGILWKQNMKVNSLFEPNFKYLTDWSYKNIKDFMKRSESLGFKYSKEIKKDLKTGRHRVTPQHK